MPENRNYLCILYLHRPRSSPFGLKTNVDIFGCFFFYTDLLSDPQIVPSAGPRPHPRLGLPGRSPASFQPVRAQDPSRAVETPGDQSTFPQGCCLAGGFLSRMLSTLYACVSHMACVCVDHVCGMSTRTSACARHTVVPEMLLKFLTSPSGPSSL